MYVDSQKLLTTGEPQFKRTSHPILPISWSRLVFHMAANRVPVDKVVHQLVLLIINKIILIIILIIKIIIIIILVIKIIPIIILLIKIIHIIILIIKIIIII